MQVRSRLSWLRGLPLLVRYLVRTMPWVTLSTGCGAGLAIFTILVRVAHHDQATFWLDHGTIRPSLLPAAARAGLRPVHPVPPADPGHPGPRLGDPGRPPAAGRTLPGPDVLGAAANHGAGHPPARPQDPHEPDYALIAQLIGWSAIIVAAAACVARSRFADLGGAIAVPVSFAVIAVAWYTPQAAEFLVDPPTIPRSVTVGWYAIAAAALALTCGALRDTWHRRAWGIVPRLPGRLYC